MEGPLVISGGSQSVQNGINNRTMLIFFFYQECGPSDGGTGNQVESVLIIVE